MIGLVAVENPTLLRIVMGLFALMRGGTNWRRCELPLKTDWLCARRNGAMSIQSGALFPQFERL